MNTFTFEKLMKSIFFKDDIYKISDTVYVISFRYAPMEGYRVFTMESTVAGLDMYAANSHAVKVFAQAIAGKDYGRLIELVDAEENDPFYEDREAMNLARRIADVSANDFELPYGYLEGVTGEDLARYRVEYGDA